jgi:hypothetical protein
MAQGTTGLTMTIDDEFYLKIGRMTVAFGELDFIVGYFGEHGGTPG